MQLLVNCVKVSSHFVPQLLPKLSWGPHFEFVFEGQTGAMVAEWKQSPPNIEIGVGIPVQSQVGKLVIACSWSAVYSTEP